MARTVTATEAKAQLLALLDEVGGGEEIEITRHGRLIARLVPARGGAALRGRFSGLSWSTTDDPGAEFSTGEDWPADLPDAGPDAGPDATTVATTRER